MTPGRLLCSFCLCFAAFADAQDPLLHGRVTDAGTPTRFRLDATTVLCEPGHTLVTTPNPAHSKSARSGVSICRQFTLGEPLDLYGGFGRNKQELAAIRIDTMSRRDTPVQGFALVDRMIAPLNKGILKIRADGYNMALTPDTKLKFPEDDVRRVDEITTNVWVRYQGVLHPDGSVTATELTAFGNAVPEGEGKLRKKTTLDAKAVREDQRQSAMSRFFLGLDGKRIPAYDDAPMQARLDRIGARLIPAYQASLPKDDPSRIPFQFQLVNDARLKQSLALPSGIVLVPYQMVERLNDDQLAAVLATSVTVAVQKQQFLMLNLMHSALEANLAGAAVGLLLPGVGLATQLVTGTKGSHEEHALFEQQMRLSLCLMDDAGFDIRQAPMAWWLLAAGEKHRVEDTPLPLATRSLLQILDAVWHDKLVAEQAGDGAGKP